VDASQGARCHRSLPHRGTGWSSGSVQSAAAISHLLQLMRSRHCPKCQGNARASGWPRARLSYCRALLPYRLHAAHELSALALGTSGCSTICSSAQAPQRCSNWLVSQAPRSRYRRSWCAPYLGRTFSIILMSTTSFPPAAWLPTAPDGSIPRADSSCRPRTEPRLPRQVRRRTEATRRSEQASVHGAQQYLATPGCFANFLRQLFRQDWVVYAKPPFGGAEHVLNYLARYTHRVAISNIDS